MSLKIQGLHKSFNGRAVLNGIHLTLAPKEIVFVLGRSGTGKSVLLKNIVGLMGIDKGDIFLDGQKISGLSEQELFPVRKKCGMVFQQPALFDSLSIFDNLFFGLKRLNPFNKKEFVETKIYQTLQLVGLDKNISSKLPQEISYGMQKRASLARTLVLDPNYLLFDEPTTGLDPQATTAINDLISSTCRKLGAGALVVSHDMKCALEIADRIILLHEGQIIAEGSPTEFKNFPHPLVQDFLGEVNE